MNREFVKEWVEALRSDKYIQGRHQLKDGNCYCCLGVAVAIHPECNISDVWLESKKEINLQVHLTMNFHVKK